MSPRWWQRGVVYEVYARSFGDSDGDGVGDLAGISERLDYLAWLGVDAIWLSPIFASPMADFGYDVADYRDVDPLFGTLEDLDALIDAAHGRGIRLLLDLVPNHTSDRHAWFEESRSALDSAKRDWYIWRPPRPDGSPPNDWQSFFGGSAWQLDPRSGEYYFHSFLAQQPDLNWANRAVRDAIYSVMRFWLGRGIDGFRIDVVNLLAKRYELQAGTPAGRRQRWAASTRIYPIIREMRAVADEFDDRVLVGEIWLPLRRLVKFYGRQLDGLQLPFNFKLVTLPWSAGIVHRAIAEYERLLPPGAWPNWVLGNHDKPRIASRVGDQQARVAAVLLLTLRGTPTIYYGDELGMRDADVPASEQRDPQGLRGGRSRDPARTPMRWDGSPRGGFSDAQPWLPVGADVAAINVAAQQADESSMLNLYRRLLQLRREEPALNVGEWHDRGRRRAAIAYERSAGARRFLVLANLSDRAVEAPLSAVGTHGSVLVSTLTSEPAAWSGRRRLEANEALVVLLD